MRLVDKSQDASAVLIRPFSTIRGAGRIAKLVNSTHLALGASPIKTARLRDGSQLIVDLRSHTEWYSYYSGLYDEDYINILKHLTKLGGNFLDVGSNIGLVCIQIARLLSNIQTVFCFEPLTTNFKRLEENIILNNLESRIRTFNFGLSDQECTVDITLREDFQAGSSTGNAAISISLEADQDFKKEKIELKRLDDLIASIHFGHVKLAKVDIEGHEDYFLAGAQTFLRLHQPIILCEINKPYYRWRNRNLDETFRHVLPNNYSIFRIKRLERRVGLEQIYDFSALGEIENVFFCTDNTFGSLYDAVCYQG